MNHAQAAKGILLKHALSLPIAPVLAKAPACSVERVFFPYETTDAAGKWTGTRDFEMVLFRDRCDVKHLWTPRLACDFFWGTSHGATGVSCEGVDLGSWRVRTARDRRSYFDTQGEGTAAIVPSLAALRTTYAHLDDDDHAKPIYKDDFPKRFLSVGPITRIENPDLAASMQTFRYQTMKGEDRFGISADAVVGCLKYQFGVILDPSRGVGGTDLLRDKERDVASFLRDLRLDRVDDPIGRLRDLHTVFDQKRLLQPITACVPR